MLRGTLKAVTVEVGTNRIAHKLGCRPVGWFAVRVTGAAAAARETAADDATHQTWRSPAHHARSEVF